jgi:hypothetical protein
VASKLCLEWSPEQIAGWLKRTYPDDETYQVSHETIYRSLFIQARGALKKELMAHLRRTRACAVRDTTPRRPAFTVELLTRYPSASVLLRPKTEPYPVTGKATFYSAARIARSRRSSSVNLAT